MTSVQVLNGKLKYLLGRAMLMVRVVPGRGDDMAFEELKAQIGLLLGEMNEQPEDLHELYLQIHQELLESLKANNGLKTGIDSLAADGSISAFAQDGAAADEGPRGVIDPLEQPAEAEFVGGEPFMLVV